MNPGAAPTSRRLRRACAVLVLAVIAVGVAGWHERQPAVPPPAGPRPDATPVWAAAPSPSAAPITLLPPSPPPVQTSSHRDNGRSASTIGVDATDLREVFDKGTRSHDPRRRRAAARAFETCVPAFIAVGGESASPEALIRALPADYRAERAAAIRMLFERCAGLVVENRDALARMQRRLQRDRDTRPIGKLIEADILAGRYENIDALIAGALTRDDPAEIASLSGIAIRLAGMRDADASDPELRERARAIDAALPWVACDLGLDCSATSNWALGLCAGEALCEGDVLFRVTGKAVEDGVDPGRIRREHARLSTLVAAGLPLGARDLLP